MEVRTIMANMKTPIIAVSIALVAVIVTIVVLALGGNASGIYVSGVTGSVNISGDSDQTPASAELTLKQGDIVTVGPNSSCTITYKGKDNSEENYIVLGSNTQLIVNSKFTGSNSGELFLNRGSLIANLSGESKGEVNIRTANAMVYVQKTVSKVAYYDKDSKTYTDIINFRGNPKIQLYDQSGNPVNEMEPLLEKHTGCVVTGDAGPSFEYLNVEFSLSVLTAEDLKSITTIALTQGADFPYEMDVLREAYAAVTDALPDITSSVTSEPIITAAPIINDPGVVTAVPDVTSAPPNTNFTVPTLSVATRPATAATTPAVTTPAVDTSRILTVIVTIGDEEIMNEVPYGGSVDKPDDPVITGYTFTGWSRSFSNITEDCTIYAQFIANDGSGNTIGGSSSGGSSGGDPSEIPEPDPSEPSDGDDTLTHTVTIVIGTERRTITVKDGDSANLASTIEVPGYRFLGWDRDTTHIYEDCTITAMLEPATGGTTAGTGTKHTVTFMIEGVQNPVEVEDGGTAIPPFYPGPDRNGNEFKSWDKPLTNIKADTVITAIYAESTSFTVTFVIDGNSYQTTVKNGETAVPPFVPQMDMFGRTFIGWDKSLSNLTADQTITAQFQ
jgi:hypothetical protein